jgi:hypothetical protein
MAQLLVLNLNQTYSYSVSETPSMGTITLNERRTLVSKGIKYDWPIL